MLKTVSAIKVRQNLGLVMNEVALKSDEYIVERSGKPLVAIIPIERYLNMKNKRDNFFQLYNSIQKSADRTIMSPVGFGLNFRVIGMEAGFRFVILFY